MMPQSFVRAVFGAVLLALTLVTGSAGAAYTPPTIQGALTDTSGTLSKADRDRLEQRLGAYRKRTTNEVVVFVLASLEGQSVEDVAYETFNQWKIGKKAKDNGVLVVIALSDKRMRIETGKGVGDRLTDLESGRILRERLGPFLKQQRTSDGIHAALDAIEAALDGAPAPPLPSLSASANAAPTPAGLDAKRVRIFDYAHLFPAGEVAAENERIQAKWKTWSSLAIAIVPSSMGFSEALAVGIRRQVGTWPTVVLVSVPDKKVWISGAPDFGEAKKSEARTRMLARLAVAPAVTFDVLGELADIGFEIERKPPGESTKGESKVMTFAVLGFFASVVGFISWGLFFRKRRRSVDDSSNSSSYGSSSSSSWESSSSSYDSSSSSSSYDSSSSSSSYDSSSSSSSDSGGYSGGDGGSSGGGGASDSW